MSFTFNWPQFSDQFHYDAIQMLNTALNKGSKPPVMADKIEVVELQMGTQPPELEIRDIGDLTMDQFRGIFRLTYSGDAHIVLKTKVQANPLNHKQPDIHLMAGSRGMLAAKQPLVVPMLLRLSHFRLNSYVVLVVSKQKGITLVFKTDPLQNVDINSTFDSIAVIQKFIQREIEGQLRQMFREDLPGIIHRLSQQWVKAKVEAPYLIKPPPLSRRRPFQRHTLLQPQLNPANYRRSRSLSGISMASTSRRVTATPTSLAKQTPNDSPTSFPDLENFDPTYGLRPEGLPTKSVFSGFSSLFTPNKGLADLEEEASEDDYEDEVGSFDIVDWENAIPDHIPPPPPTVSEDVEDVTEYETIPAVGGGTIIRPRIFHSQSLPHTPSDVSVSRPALPKYNHPSITGFDSFSVSDLSEYPSRASSEPTLDQAHRYSSFARPITPDSLETQPSRSSGTQSMSASQSSDARCPEDESLIPNRPALDRRLSVSSSDVFHFGHHHHMHESDPKIVLRPSLNNSIHQLSTLSHSNHTLSPYTRSFAHFTVRSVPPRVAGASGMSLVSEKQPVKAKRKRMYRLGARPKSDTPPNFDTEDSSPPSSLVPPPEFDASDLDRYFRSQEDFIPQSPNIHPTHVRLRKS